MYGKMLAPPGSTSLDLANAARGVVTTFSSLICKSRQTFLFVKIGMEMGPLQCRRLHYTRKKCPSVGCLIHGSRTNNWNKQPTIVKDCSTCSLGFRSQLGKKLLITTATKNSPRTLSKHQHQEEVTQVHGPFQLSPRLPWTVDSIYSAVIQARLFTPLHLRVSTIMQAQVDGNFPV